MQSGPARETLGNSAQRISLFLPWGLSNAAEKRIISYLAMGISDHDGAFILAKAQEKTRE